MPLLIVIQTMIMPGPTCYIPTTKFQDKRPCGSCEKDFEGFNHIWPLWVWQPDFQSKLKIPLQLIFLNEKIFEDSEQFQWTPEDAYIISSICEPNGSWKSVCRFRRRFLKGFYHILVWRPSWSCDQHHVIRFSFPFT